MSPNLVGRDHLVAVRVDECALHLEFRDLGGHQAQLGKFDAFVSIFYPAVNFEISGRVNEKRRLANPDLR